MKETNPLQNMYRQIKTLLQSTVFKDKQAAELFETSESRWEGAAYVKARIKDDNYTSYSDFWTFTMFLEVKHNVKQSEFLKYKSSPRDLPLIYQDHLREAGRQAFLDSYEERNNYYRMLIGLPDYGETEFVYPSEELLRKYSLPNTPVHLMNDYQQDLYMTMDEYSQVLSENPTKRYLRYLGSKRVDLFTARTALDFDIIRYPNGDESINPRLLSSFANIYPECREYVMTALYNEKLADIYVNYREFLGMLMIAMTLMQLNANALDGVNSHDFIDDSLLHTLFSMYNIPEDIIMTDDVRRSLAHNLLKLVHEKGTDKIYYDLVEILGYENVRVSKLMLMKGQQFSEEGESSSDSEPYFLQLDLKDSDPYRTISNGEAPILGYHDVISGDPEWWDLPDVKQRLTDANFTSSESKYIALDASVSQSKYIFETIYFTRMILDNKSSTENFIFEIPDLFGSEKVSVFDCVLFLLCALCLSTGLSGSLSKESEELLASAGFNFDYDRDIIDDFVSSSKYIDRKKLEQYLRDLTMIKVSDISRVFTGVLLPLHDWLERKIAESTERDEFVEYEAIYRALFTYDVTRNPIIDDFKPPIEVVTDDIQLTKEEVDAFREFYPHDLEGRTIRADELSSTINNTRYHYPFLALGEEVPWYIDLGNSGILYFYDILNCADCRELTNSNGDRIFMDWVENTELEEGGEWVLNEEISELALDMIENMPEEALGNAYFQVETPSILNPGTFYSVGQKLSANIRNGAYRTILRNKLSLDLNGYAVSPDSYFECLYRQNFNLYSLLFRDNRFETDKESWVSDVSTVISALEKNIGIHLANIEQSVVGKELYFRPLVTLINRFKSMMVRIAKTDLRIIFDDKFDVGGNSNMLKLFDSVHFALIFTTVAGSGYESHFGLYDAQHSQKTHILLSDRSEPVKDVSRDGFSSQRQKKRIGSMHMSDECILYQSGETDGWLPGDPNNGRWSSDDYVLMKTRDSVKRIPIPEYDMEGWKDLTESLSPVE